MNQNNLLLSFEEMNQKYKEFADKGIRAPYFYQIQKGDQHLFFIGTNHVYDPEHEQNKVIKKYWSEFLNLTKGRDSIVLVEGGLGPVEKNEQDAISKYAESGLAEYLAHQENIPVDSPEPNEVKEIRQLEKNFSKDDIIYYYFARIVAQWHRKTVKKSLEEFVQPYLDHDKKNSGWTDFDFTVANLAKIHDKTHGHRYDPNNYDCFYHDSNPNFNKVAAFVSRFRNEYIFSEIKKYWQEVINNQKPGERYRSIYFDENEGEIKLSDIIHGQYISVPSDTVKLFKVGHTPLFEVHTHPYDSMFSAPDYDCLVNDATVRGGVRLVRGAILLCPNLQIMALAAPSTMFVKPDEVEQFFERHNLYRSEIGARIQELDLELHQLINDPFFKWMELALEIDKSYFDEEQLHNKGLLSDDELKTVQDRIGNRYAKGVKDIFRDFRDNMGKRSDPLKHERNRLYNQNEWQIAREVQPVLYLATDFRHFKQFSDSF